MNGSWGMTMMKMMKMTKRESKSIQNIKSNSRMLLSKFSYLVKCCRDLITYASVEKRLFRTRRRLSESRIVIRGPQHPGPSRDLARDRGTATLADAARSVTTWAQTYRHATTYCHEPTWDELVVCDPRVPQDTILVYTDVDVERFMAGCRAVKDEEGVRERSCSTHKSGVDS